MITDSKYLEERDRRIALLNKLMEDKGLDCLAFSSTSQMSYTIATKYVSGFQIDTRRDYVFMKSGEMPRLIVPTVGQQFQARRQSWLPEECVFSGDMLGLLTGWIRELGSKPRVGVYEIRELPVYVYEALKDTGAELVDVTRAYTDLRQRKSEFEIECIKKASDMAIASFEHIVRLAKVGMTEEELVCSGEGYLRAHGAYDTLVLTRSIYPHSFIGRASRDVVMQEDTAMVYSAEVAGEFGYWTQVLRPIFFSRGCQPEVLRIQNIIREAEAAGAEAMKIGNTVGDVAKAVEKVIADYGCKSGIWCGHGMGHDLGDGVDIGSTNDMEIVPNMILTLHPSILSETDGSLFGDTWRATPGGAELLCPKYHDVYYLDELKELVNAK